MGHRRMADHGGVVGGIECWRAAAKVVDDEFAFVDGGLDEAHAAELADDEDAGDVGFEVLLHERDAHSLEHTVVRQDNGLGGTDFGALGVTGAAFGVREDGFAAAEFEGAGFGTFVDATAAANTERCVDERLGLAARRRSRRGGGLLLRSEVDGPHG